MRTNFLSITLAAAVSVSATAVSAQKAPTKEFGVDVVLSSTGLSGSESRVTRAATPVDIRVGFLNESPMSLEPRFGFIYLASQNDSFISFTPSLNVLFRISNGIGVNRHMGGYLAAGVLMDLQRVSSEGSLGSDTETSTQFGFTVGAGTRIEWGTAAFRPELFFSRKLQKGEELDSDFIPGSNTFGVRFGISFFQ